MASGYSAHGITRISLPSANQHQPRTRNEQSENQHAPVVQHRHDGYGSWRTGRSACRRVDRAFVGVFVGVGVGSTPKRSEVKRATTTSPLLPKAACAPPAVPGKFMEVVLPATYTSPAAFEGEKVRICCFLLFS
jgi:hypothetical protein